MRRITGRALSVRHHRYPPLTSAMPSSALLSNPGRLAAAPCAVLLTGLRFASAPPDAVRSHTCPQLMTSWARSKTASYVADHNMWISELAPCFARSRRAPTRVLLLSSARHLVSLGHSTAPCARLATRDSRRRLPLRPANAAALATSNMQTDLHRYASADLSFELFAQVSNFCGRVRRGMLGSWSRRGFSQYAHQKSSGTCRACSPGARPLAVYGNLDRIEDGRAGRERVGETTGCGRKAVQE